MAGNKFQIKRTGVASRTPNTTNVSNTAYIDVGELALNFADRILYSSNGSVSFEIGANVTNQNITGTLTANGGVGTANQVLFTSGSGVYWGNIGDVAQGEPGEGVANGGVTGDILVKASGTDYDTAWTSNIDVDSVTFTSNVEYDNPATGELHWDLDEGTLDLGLEGTDVTLRIGQESVYRVTNQSGNTINKGDVVVAAGTLGASGRILVDVWDGSQTTQTLMGLAAEDISDTADGYVIEFGKLRLIDTSGTPYGETWANGDILYAGSSGGLTNVQPEAPNTKTILALVIYADATVGELFIRPTFSSDLGDDDLVQLTSIANNQIIRYDGANSRFENVNLSLAVEQTTVNSISIGNTLQQSNTANTTVTTATTISQWPTASYASSKAVITATSNGERQVSELLVSYNSSNAFATEYGILVTGSTLFTVDCSLTGGNVVIQVSSTSTTATNYTIHEILTEV